MQSCTHRLTLQHVVTASLQTTAGVFIVVAVSCHDDGPEWSCCWCQLLQPRPPTTLAGLHHTGATLQGESSRQLSSRTSLQHYSLCTHCRVCPVCAHTAALQHDPALQPCPGCCEETAHALTMHCIALTAAGPCCRAPWDTAATTVMLSPLDRV